MISVALYCGFALCSSLSCFGNSILILQMWSRTHHTWMPSKVRSGRRYAGGTPSSSPRPFRPELRTYPPPHLFHPSPLHFIRPLLDRCNTSIQHSSGDWRDPSHYLHGTRTRWGQGACLNYPDFEWLPYRLQYCLGSPKNSELHCCSPLFIKGAITAWNSYKPSDSLEDKNKRGKLADNL